MAGGAPQSHTHQCASPFTIVMEHRVQFQLMPVLVIGDAEKRGKGNLLPANTAK